jgi:Zn-dependent protease with chaperone function
MRRKKVTPVTILKDFKYGDATLVATGSLYEKLKARCEKAHITMPELYETNSDIVGGIAILHKPHRFIAYTEGLRNLLTEDELLEAMSHEIAHIHDYDNNVDPPPSRRHFLRMLATATGLGGFLGYQTAKDFQLNDLGEFALTYTGLATGGCIYIIGHTTNKALKRRAAEVRADKGVITLMGGDPDTYISVLEKLEKNLVENKVLDTRATKMDNWIIYGSAEKRIENVRAAKIDRDRNQTGGRS